MNLHGKTYMRRRDTTAPSGLGVNGPWHSDAAGSTLILVLILAGILTLVLGVYLNLTSTENKNSMRSLAWNAALPLAEAGIEEALSHITLNTNNFAADNWLQQGTNSFYSKQRLFGSDKYSVAIAGSPSAPVSIYSTGSVYWVASRSYISRTVEVQAQSLNFPSPSGMVARGIVFGGTVTVDSYDSTDSLSCNPANDTTGYYDPFYATDVAFVGNPVGGFNLKGNVHIYGFAAAGSGYSVTTSGSATVCSRSFGGSGIQRTPLDHGTNGFSMNMPDVAPPYQSGLTPTNGAVNGTNYTYVLYGGFYMSSNLTSAAYGKTMYVTAPSKLYITGTIDVSRIVFTNGARLDLYLSQDNVLVSSVIGTAPQFIVWGLNTCTTLTLTGSSQFVGIVYAPRANLKANGGAQFYGAMTADYFQSSGNFYFHHDQAAGKAIAPMPLTIQNWVELTAPGS
jgi:Tfp pilus assembly protein PilX